MACSVCGYGRLGHPGLAWAPALRRSITLPLGARRHRRARPDRRCADRHRPGHPDPDGHDQRLHPSKSHGPERVRRQASEPGRSTSSSDTSCCTAPTRPTATTCTPFTPAAATPSTPPVRASPWNASPCPLAFTLALASACSPAGAPSTDQMVSAGCDSSGRCSCRPAPACGLRAARPATGRAWLGGVAL